MPGDVTASHSELWDPAEEASEPKRLAHRQWELLRDILVIAESSSTFYSQLWEDAKFVADDVESLDTFRLNAPLFGKREIISDQRRNPPYGSMLTLSPSELNRVYWTSGAEALYFTATEYDGFVDQVAAAFYTCGLRPTDIVDVTTTFDWVIAGTLLDAGVMRLGAASIPGGSGHTAKHVEALTRFSCSAIFGFPTFLREIGRYAAEESGLDPATDFSVRLGIIAGEKFTDAEKADLGSTFGMVIRETYGCGEVPFVSAECPEGRLHLNPRVVVDVVDSDTGAPVLPGQPGELVLSDLTRRAQPILRYRTGDLTSGVSTGDCPCGRRTATMGRIIGRASDVMRVKGVFVLPEIVQDVIRSLGLDSKSQLEASRQDGQDVLTIRIERPTTGPQIATDKLRDSLQKELGARPEVEWLPAGILGEDSPAVVDRRL